MHQTSIQKKLLTAGRDGLPLAFKIISPVFILVAVGLAGTAVYQWFHLVMPMYGPPYTAFYFVSTGIGIFLVSQILLHYYNCIMVSPGSPGPDDRQCKRPPGLRDVDCDDNNYCKHCKFVTGEDTQHCFICGRCVTDLDHHCPWIMNCVGRDNHKYFFLFLFYVTTGCLYLACFSVPPFYTITYYHKRFSEFQPRRIDHGMLSLCAILPMTLTVAVGGMMLWHCYLLGTAQTSPEFALNCHSKLRAYKKGQRWSNPKDMGFAKNWQTRFGLENNNFWFILWLFPYVYEPSKKNYDRVEIEEDLEDGRLGNHGPSSSAIIKSHAGAVSIQQRAQTVHHV